MLYCIVMHGSIVSTVRIWELVCIRALYFAHCSSTWCWKRFRRSSTLVCCGCCSALVTWCSSQTPRRSVSVGSRRGKLVWKVKGIMSTWITSSSWSLMLAMMSYGTALAGVVVSEKTPSSARSASFGSPRGAVASLEDWWPTQTMSAAGVMTRLNPSMAELWLKWILAAPCLMWRLLSACWVIMLYSGGATTVLLLPDVWPGESSENLTCPNHQTPLTQYTWQGVRDQHSLCQAPW